MRSRVRIRWRWCGGCRGAMSSASRQLKSRRVRLLRCHCRATFGRFNFSERCKRGDARAGDTTRHNPREMRKVGANIDGDAVISHPAADTNANRGDFRVLLLGSDPDPGAAFAALAGNAVIAKRLDDPSFKALYVTAHVAPALVQVQQDVGDELTRPVIGILSAAAGGVHWKASGIEQVCVPGACPRRIKWRGVQKAY